VEVPSACSRSGFTALFEALIMVMARETPVAAIAAMVGKYDTRIWRVLHYHAEEARREADCSEVQRVGMDETASRRGHNYISLFFDLDADRLLYGGDGRDRETVTAFCLRHARTQGRP
jgi:transposase